jgi:hypothetical protein
MQDFAMEIPKLFNAPTQGGFQSTQLQTIDVLSP